VDELLKQVTTKAGISEAQTKKAIDAVLDGDVTKGIGGLLKK